MFIQSLCEINIQVYTTACRRSIANLDTTLSHWACIGQGSLFFCLFFCHTKTLDPAAASSLDSLHTSDMDSESNYTQHQHERFIRIATRCHGLGNIGHGQTTVYDMCSCLVGLERALESLSDHLRRTHLD